MRRREVQAEANIGRVAYVNVGCGEAGLEPSGHRKEIDAVGIA